MRVEIIGPTGRIMGMSRCYPKDEEVLVDHIIPGPAVRWQVKTFWGRLLAYGPCSSLKGDTVVINLRGFILT